MPIAQSFRDEYVIELEQPTRLYRTKTSRLLFWCSLFTILCTMYTTQCIVLYVQFKRLTSQLSDWKGSGIRANQSTNALYYVYIYIHDWDFSHICFIFWRFCRRPNQVSLPLFFYHDCKITWKLSFATYTPNISCHMVFFSLSWTPHSGLFRCFTKGALFFSLVLNWIFIPQNKCGLDVKIK